MFKTEQKSIERITELLRKEFGSRLRYVVAFGSRVRGDFSGESDFDLLIVIDKPDIEDELNAIRIVSQEEDLTGIPYVALVKSLDAFEKEKKFKTGFYQNIIREGVFFHDPECSGKKDTF